MNKTISAVEVRQKLGEILNRVALRGEEIIIERAGKPMARLIPLEPTTPAEPGKLDLRHTAGLGHELWQTIDTDAWLRAERESWD